MLNPVTLKAGLRGLRGLSPLSHTSKNQQGSFAALNQPQPRRLTFAASRTSPTESSMAASESTRFDSLNSHPIAPSSTSSSTSNLFRRLSSTFTLSRSSQSLKEAVHRPEPIKSGFLDRRSIQLPVDKQTFTISQKVLRLLNAEEQAVQQDFKQLLQNHLSSLPSPQAQALTVQAMDFFNNGVSKTLRRWILQDLSSHQPKHFTNTQGLSAGLKSYQGNLEAVDDFLNQAMVGAKRPFNAPEKTASSSKAAEATQMLEKTEQDVHDYRDALNHLILQPNELKL